MNETDYIYLASPYSHPDEDVRFKRADKVGKVGFALTEAGFNVFCPITQSLNLQYRTPAGTGNDVFEEPRGRILTHEEWMRVDKAFLSKASFLVVLTLKGWKESKGVSEEIEFAQEHSIPLYFLSPTKLEINYFIDHFDEYLESSQIDFGLVGRIPPKGDRTISIDLKSKPLTEEVWEKLGVVPMHIDSQAVRTCKEGIDGWTNPDGTFIPDLSKSNKGVKAEQAKDKPTTLNFPWAGIGGEGTVRRLIGESMAQLIESSQEKDFDHLREALHDLDYYMSVIVTDLEVNSIMVIGSKKHGMRTHLNYDINDRDLLIDAIGRHILKGIDNKDEESGEKHAAHVLANIYMLRQIIH